MYSADEIKAARKEFNLQDDQVSDNEVADFIRSTAGGSFLILRLRVRAFFKALFPSFRRADA